MNKYNYKQRKDNYVYIIQLYQFFFKASIVNYSN